MAVQMAVIILSAVLGGQYLDGKTDMHFPLWTLIGSLVGVGVSLTLFIREVR